MLRQDASEVKNGWHFPSRGYRRQDFDNPGQRARIGGRQAVDASEEFAAVEGVEDGSADPGAVEGKVAEWRAVETDFKLREQGSVGDFVCVDARALLLVERYFCDGNDAIFNEDDVRRSELEDLAQVEDNLGGLEAQGVDLEAVAVVPFEGGGHVALVHQQSVIGLGHGHGFERRNHFGLETTILGQEGHHRLGQSSEQRIIGHGRS